MRPELGATSPVSWPISVVLPAPLGPMMACSSPARTSSTMSSQATTPPKRLVRPSICRSGSGTAQARKDPIDAAAGKQHDQEQHRPQNELPVFARGRHILAGDEKTDNPDQEGQRLFQHEQGE